jgi:hypothetical protein
LILKSKVKEECDDNIMDDFIDSTRKVGKRVITEPLFLEKFGIDMYCGLSEAFTQVEDYFSNFGTS